MSFCILIFYINIYSYSNILSYIVFLFVLLQSIQLNQNRFRPIQKMLYVIRYPKVSINELFGINNRANSYIIYVQIPAFHRNVWKDTLQAFRTVNKR